MDTWMSHQEQIYVSRNPLLIGSTVLTTGQALVISVECTRRNPLLIGSTVLTHLQRHALHSVRILSQSPPNRVNGSHIMALYLKDFDKDLVAIPS